MADAAYDVVIIGGGAKSLITAIYLAKYGGLEVAIFERRHEMGGGLASDEAAAPGFIGDPHATNISDWYYLPIEQDFPDFAEKGGELVHFKTPGGIITREDQKCCVIYYKGEDPTQEKTAEAIARFAGEKDAETYLKIWRYGTRPESSYYDAHWQTAYNLPPPPGEKSALDRWWDEFLGQPDCPVDTEWPIFSGLKASRLLFDNTALCFMWLRINLAAGVQHVEPWGGRMFVHRLFDQPIRCIIAGGTHGVAHAYIRIFLENGGKFFTHSHVDKILMENGRAKGVRLSDGTEVEARQLVLSGVDVRQLCLNLIDKERLSERVLKKAGELEGGWDAITWYTWALREAPKYKAAAFNPEIDTTQNIVLGTYDLEVLQRESYLRRVGVNPPIASAILQHQYTQIDKKRAPEGRHTVLTEQFVVPANVMSEPEWLQFKRQHAEDTVGEWGVFSDNLTWDNIMGYDPLTPYDTAARLINMAPSGDWALYNTEHWRPQYARPMIELANYRIANIKHLYGTGGSWSSGGHAPSGYLAYKVIAEDLGLRKPWEEKERPY